MENIDIDEFAIRKVYVYKTIVVYLYSSLIIYVGAGKSTKASLNSEKNFLV